MGSEIVKAMLAEGKLKVTAITRPDSESKMPSGVTVSKVNYDDASGLAEVLKGHDALIITMANTAPPEQSIKLVEAAAAADVAWVMPNWYGNDGNNKELCNDTMLGPMLWNVTKRIEELGKSNWVALACGFWYEWSLFGPPSMGLGPLMYGFDAPNRTVTFFDNGEQKINSSTWPLAGQAVARLFALPINSEGSGPSISQFKSDFVFVSSFLITQKEMFESIKRVTNTSDSDWKITSEPSVSRYETARDNVQKGFDMRSFATALYTRMFFQNGDGNFEAKHGLANEALGLPKQQDLDDATRAAIKYAEVSF